MSESKISQGKVRQVFILLLLFSVGVLIVQELLPYLGGVLGAITLYVLLVKLQIRLESKGWRASIAAIMLMVVSSILILLPVVGTVLMFSTKVGQAVRNSERIVSAVKEQLKVAEDYTGMELAGSINASEISSWVSRNLQSLATSSFAVFVALGIMYFLLYYMLTARGVWHKALKEYLPLKRQNVELISTSSRNLVKSNAIGIPLVAILQGIVALVGYLMFGVSDPFFWFVITAIGSMIPFVGTALGIIPVTVLLISQGETFSAIAILIWGIAVVGVTDNIFRLFVQKRLADIHPLITLVGVVIGVPLFGFIGLIFGPLLVSLFLLLVKIYKHEYAAKMLTKKDAKLIANKEYEQNEEITG